MNSNIKGGSRWIWAATLIVSVVMLLGSALRVQRMLSSSSWPTVSGMIAESDHKHDPLIRGILNYKLHIVYQYSVNGTRYESKRVSFDGKTDYLFRRYDPDAPMTPQKFILGALGLSTCLGIAWVWWELIKKYAGH